MERLIDEDELIKGRVENDPVVIAAKCTPTAYDTDKVAEQLDKASDYYEFDEQGMEHVQMLRLVDAIEIVKGGGVDGN